MADLTDHAGWNDQRGIPGRCHAIESGSSPIVHDEDDDIRPVMVLDLENQRLRFSGQVRGDILRELTSAARL